MYDFTHSIVLTVAGPVLLILSTPSTVTQLSTPVGSVTVVLVSTSGDVGVLLSSEHL